MSSDICLNVPRWLQYKEVTNSVQCIELCPDLIHMAQHVLDIYVCLI